MKVRYCGPLLVLLAGCGGDTSAPPPISVVSPAPTPTPTPTSTPAPTTATYQTAFDFTRDRIFTGLVTAKSYSSPSRIVYGNLDSEAVVYTAATQAIAVAAQVIVPGVRDTTLERTSDRLTYSYRIGVNTATLTMDRGSAETTYVAYLIDDDPTPLVAGPTLVLIGAPTLASDLPTTGTRSYRLTAAQTRTLTSGRTQIDTTAIGQALVVDAATRRIGGTIAITPTGATAPVNALFQGDLNPATGRLDGVVTTADGSYAGEFHGRAYGPGSMEIALIFDLVERSSGKILPGIILGRAG